MADPKHDAPKPSNQQPPVPKAPNSPSAAAAKDPVAKAHEKVKGMKPMDAFKAIPEATHRLAEAQAEVDALNSARGAPSQQPSTVGDGPYDSLIAASGLKAGELGWLLLDVDGIPTALQKDTPEYGIVACRVLVAMETKSGFHGLTTAAGAPLVVPLQGNPDFRPNIPEIVPGQNPAAGRTSKNDERRAAGKAAEAAYAG